MNNSNWIRLSSDYEMYIFGNKSNNPLVEYIQIKKYEFIILKLKKDKIDKIYEDLSQLCQNKNHIIKYINDIGIYYKSKSSFIFEEIIHCLEKLEEIHPLEILKDILKTWCNPCNYPKILKNKIDPNITKINFSILQKLDKEYHDNFINSLNIKNKIKILKYNRHCGFYYNFYMLNNLINMDLNINKINKLIEIIDFLTTRNINYDKIYENTNI